MNLDLFPIFKEIPSIAYLRLTPVSPGPHLRHYFPLHNPVSLGRVNILKLDLTKILELFSSSGPHSRRVTLENAPTPAHLFSRALLVQPVRLVPGQFHIKLYRLPTSSRRGLCGFKLQVPMMAL